MGYSSLKSFAQGGTHATIHIMSADNGREIPRYEQLADELRTRMKKGVLRSGDRIPSIREMSRRSGLSINTVIRAYRSLERAHLVEMRPQSGCFVRPETPPLLCRQQQEAEAPEHRTASTSALWYEVHEDAESGRGVNPGMIGLDPGLIPTAQLNRLLSSVGRRFAGKCTSGKEINGEERLRREISRRCRTRGCPLTSGDLLITGGCSDALFLALMALTSPGDSIIVEQPFFTSALKLWESLRLNIIEVPADPRDGMDTALLSGILKGNGSGRISAMVIVSSFSNPLGSLMTEEKKREIALLAGKYDIPLIEDDIFGELSFSGVPVPLIKSHDRTGNVLLISSFSKSLAPGYRTGWIAPGKYMKRIRGLKMAAGNTAAVPVQLALAEFLEGGGFDRHLRRIRPLYRSRMEALTGAVQRSFPAGTRINIPEGGLVLWVKMPEEINALDLYTRARGRGIHILPGALFTLTGLFRSSLRFSFARADAGCIEAVEELGREIRYMCFQKR